MFVRYRRGWSSTTGLSRHRAISRDIAAVKDANPFSGVTVEALAAKRGAHGMTVGHWARFVCNRATRREDTAIGEQEWNARPHHGPGARR